MNRALALTLLLFCSASAAAVASAPAETPVASAGSLLQVLFGLIVVLALMAGAAWMLRRMGVAGVNAGNVARVVGGVSVGNRERVLVVEIADQWIVVGVAPGRVNALSAMPRRELPHAQQVASDSPNFASWLKQTIDKRNAR
jgi:flagellar protein FliO/FliZ